MKKVIILDDNQDKADELAKTVRSLVDNVEISIFSCRNSGLYHIYSQRDDIKKCPDDYFIITDMCMPLFEGEPPEPDMGFEVLEEIDRLKLGCPVVVATASDIKEFMDIEEKAGTYQCYAGAIRYHVSCYMKPQVKEVLPWEGKEDK